MATIMRRRASIPLILVVAGVIWIGLIFGTCSVFHGDPVAGAAGFDPARNTVIDLYSLVTIGGVTSRTAPLVISGLLGAEAALVIAGLLLAIHRRVQ